MELYSVADQYHFDGDPDPDPAFHFDADRTLMRIRILPIFDADPHLDHTNHFFPDLDPPMIQNDPF